MSARIHPTAVVDPAAELAGDVEIGPYCVIGPDVRLSEGVRLGSHVAIERCTEIGPRTSVGPFAVLGGAPQDLSYRDEPTRLIIGADAIIREHVSMHRGTVRGRGETRVGDGGYFMAQSHVAHDCIVGDKVILSHGATLGGHVVIEDKAILGGLCAVHQRARVGRNAFVGGLAALVDDLIPFGSAFGNHAKLAGLNVVGLKRGGFSKDEIHALRRLYRQLFQGPGAFQDRLAEAEAGAGDDALSRLVLTFIREGGARPLCMPERGRA